MTKHIVLFLAIACATSHNAAAAQLHQETLQAWDTYVRLTETRIDKELGGASGFLGIDFLKAPDVAQARAFLKSGQVYVRELKTSDAKGRDIAVPDGLIHHWYAAVFLPGMRLEPLLQWVQNYDQHQSYFKEVDESKLISRDGDTFKIFLKLTRTKFVTVHYSTDHTVVYRRHGPGQVSSRSVATRIAQIDGDGKVAPAGDDGGYLWRLNSYWRFKEENGGVVVECESVSLSRSIPFGFGWMVGGIVKSVPRESLESTLLSIRNGAGAVAMNGH